MSRVPPLHGPPKHNCHQHGEGAPVTKDTFLTVHWNNLLSLGLGIPTLLYVVAAFSTPLWSERAGLIGLAVFGAIF